MKTIEIDDAADPHELENQLDMLEKKIAAIAAGVEAAAAAAAALVEERTSAHADGSVWIAEKLSDDVLDAGECFAELRKMVYLAAPAVKAEAARRAAFMDRAAGQAPADG